MLRILVVLCFVGVVAATLLVASPFAGDDGITACAHEQNGQLRLVADEAECLPSELAVSWSAGGASGTSFETVTASFPPTQQIVTGTATCPAGGRVVGGGAHAVPDNGGNVLGDYPVDDTAWRATVVVNTFANPQSVVVYATCAISP